MNKKSIILFFVFVLISVCLSAIDKEKFNEVMAELKLEKYDAVENFINANKEELKADPEYYVILLNYSLKKGRQSHVVLSAGKPKEGDLTLKKSGTDETVGHLDEEVEIDEKLILDAISRTKIGLESFKNRLDIHLGVVSLAANIKRWDLVGEQLISILSISKAIDNKWKWGYIGELDSNPKKFMLETVQSKVFALFYAEDKTADEMMIKISNKMIEIYPKIIFGYSNLATLHLAKEEFEQAEKYFNQALSIDPKDEIVLSNLQKLKELKKK